jgi:hypothetical protein
MAFLSGTTCKELVRELGCNTPITANDLMDIITNFTTNEEAVGAIRIRGSTRRSRGPRLEHKEEQQEEEELAGQA